MKIGIVGLSLCGKTTLFNALTGSAIDTTAYLGGKKDAHHAIVKVPDERIERLNEIFMPKKKTLATIEYIDLAGLSANPQKKGGFSDQFLGQIRLVDAILVQVRQFVNGNVPHPLDKIDPQRDLELIQSEFILSDLSIIENRLGRLEKQLRVKKTDSDTKEYALLEKFKALLEDGKVLRDLELSAEDELMIRGFQFLSRKPIIVVININEDEISQEDALLARFSGWQGKNSRVVPIAAQIESEIQQLSAEEAVVFRADLGIETSAMDRLIRESFSLLGIINFFTVGEDEVRAWTIPANTAAPMAAGAIHTDFERGFIRAEVVAYLDFIQRKSLAQCRNDGVLRLEGRDYIVKDGDIINFRFAI
ncbi:MAG TPA: redox-regulated ATPase YchF [bacterium]|nr:redox-regulated ATPase YchF [bacterium]HNT64520.1 redox-regulated ATPase YchF [bacterium]HOX84635.1 redox-regulated ATPase YchF [bacterium]HPG45358.1 redox-regulated ATPase YchF [bacterium]HPM96866.1 redox-regulated ATPase YchF [bacterium]